MKKIYGVTKEARRILGDNSWHEEAFLSLLILLFLAIVLLIGLWLAKI